MMARLGQNLGIKLLSLACSYALFYYVHKQQTSVLPFQVPLTILLDPNTRVTDPALMHRMVSVTLSGPADRLKDLDRQTRAVIDLRGRGSGAYPHEPVEVRIGPNNTTEAHAQVEANWTPHVLTIELEQQSSRRLAVQTMFNVQPPPGFSVDRVRAVPSAAVVSGWESDLRRVKRLQAIINSLGSAFRPEVDLVVPVRAVDAQGLEVDEGIQVLPPTIKVQATLARSVWSKPVYVSPLLADMPSTVRLQRMSVTPRRLTLSGPEDLVGPVQFLETEPITIPNIPGVVDRDVRVILPPGVKTEERPRVRVVIALQGGKL
jgi:hypothetical protein